MRISDWSSDVCSSDLHAEVAIKIAKGSAHLFRRLAEPTHRLFDLPVRFSCLFLKSLRHGGHRHGHCPDGLSKARHLGARARSDGITDSLAAATTDLVDALLDRTQMGDHRSHLLFESAIERSSQLLGEGTEGGSLFLQLLQLIARNTLRRERSLNSSH